MNTLIKKSIKQFTAILLILSVVLTPGQRAEAKEVADAGYLTSSGNMEVRWSDEERDEYAYIPFKVAKDGYITFTANNVPEKAGNHIRGEWFLCNSARKKLSAPVRADFIMKTV